jgi:hypothetical protein
MCIVRKGEEEKGTPIRAGALFSTGDPWIWVQFRRNLPLVYKMLSSHV